MGTGERRSMVGVSANGRRGAMRLTAYVLTAGLLVYAVAAHNGTIATLGAVIFALALIPELFSIYKDAQAHRAGSASASENAHHGLRDVAEQWLGTAIVLAGLGLLVFGSELVLAGAVIWMGTIAAWFLSGVIFSRVTGIPLKMGYGGWYVPYRRRRRRFKTQARPASRTHG